MQLFGLKLGKKQTEAGKAEPSATKTKKKLDLDLKNRFQRTLKTAGRFQMTIIALAVGGLLATTALKMLHYTDPPADDTKVQQDLSKFKQIRIDPKTVQKIQQLQGSGATTGPSIENGRSNPFSE